MSKKKKLTVKSMPVYQPLLDDLLSSFKNGTIKPGQWLLGENALAREYGIGHLSVRKALGFLEKEGYIKRMPGRGTQVLEKPADLTEILILCLKPYYDAEISENSFYLPVINIIRGLARKQGIITKLIYHDWLEDTDPQEYWSSITFSKSTGVILVGETQPQCIPDLSLISGPAVQVDHRIPGLALDSVEPDNFESGRMMAAHLAGLGHTQMVYLGWHLEKEYNPERVKGVLQGLKESSIPGLAAEPAACTLGMGDDDPASGYTAMKDILDKGVSFTGVMTYDHQIALGAIRAMEKADIQVPEDVSVICAAPETVYDNSGRPLTHVTIDREGIARHAFERLLWRFEHMNKPPEELKNPVLLIPGATSMRMKEHAEKDI